MPDTRMDHRCSGRGLQSVVVAVPTYYLRPWEEDTEEPSVDVGSVQCHGRYEWRDLEQCTRSVGEYSGVLLPTRVTLSYTTLSPSGLSVPKVMSCNSAIKIK